MDILIPFEPISTEDFPTGPNWIGQVKWDGVRVVTYFDGQTVRLYNRKQNERTYHYPELTDITTYCSASSIILDGEIIAFREGKPSFYEVMKRDGLRKLDQINLRRHTVPITYMIFDVLFLEGKWVTSLPLTERQELLKKVIKPNETVQLVENFNDASTLYEVIKQQEMEGVIIKDITSSYVINGKDSRWRKKKFYKDLIAVVGGVTLRDNIVNSLLLGLYNKNGLLVYIGHAGTGRLTNEDWRTLTKGIQPLIQNNMPFATPPPRNNSTIWLTPKITVKVKFAEWIEGHSLRQPSIQAIVTISPHDCRL
ncbi:ATP-dependent DNA ligase [Brevibacillus daliensis]|uniref:ATP-dependent DNA ligase n=1 Tax=Brevibacillus daliensis TaxID=2892995 RepID=UPI001E3C02DB|nr:RNA ligase family protein [Brevibacillus daliensis]